MKCPVDKSDMFVVEYQAIELDYCPQCRGVWFDSGELDLLLHTMKLEEAGLSREGILGSPESKSAGKKRKCPVCGHKMRESTLGHDPGVLIDICPRGEGLWFDGGELGQLATQLMNRKTPGDSPQRILSFLGEVFKAGK